MTGKKYNDQQNNDQERIEDIAGIVIKVMEEKDKVSKGWRKWIKFIASNWVLFAFCVSVIGAFIGWAFLGISPLQPFEEIKFRQEEYRRKANKADYKTKIVKRHLLIGNEMLDIGRLEEAKSEFEKALELDPLSVKAQAGLLKATVFDNNNEWDPELAERRLELLQKDDPNDPHLYYFWGDLYRRMEPSLALEFYKKSIELDSTVAAAWYGIGLIYDMQRKTTEAIQMYEKAVELSEWNQTFLNNLAYQYYKTNRFEEAKELYHKILSLDSRYLLSYYTYAGALLYSGNHYEAYLLLHALVDAFLDKNITDLERNQGLWFFHTDQNVVEFSDLKMKKCYAYYKLAFVAEMLGQGGEALENIKKAQELQAYKEDYIINLVRYDADRLLNFEPNLKPVIDKFFERCKKKTFWQKLLPQ